MTRDIYHRYVGVAGYDKPKGWHEGNLGKKRFMTAPYSKLAACRLKGPGMTIRVYCQMADNTIQEYGVKGKSLFHDSFVVTHRRIQMMETGRKCQIWVQQCPART